MHIDFHAKGFFYGDVAEDYARHRLGFALGRFADVVRRIDVAVEELRGTTNHPLKECRLRVVLDGTTDPVIASNRDSSIKAAIDIAAETVSRAVARQIKRRQSRQRRLAKSSSH